jgi:hypothetical protein
MEIVLDFRNPFLQILLEEILELASKLDTSGTTSDNDHVQETLHLIFSLVFESGRFNTVHDTLADFLRIADFLQEARMLSNSGNTWKESMSKSAIS